MWDSVDVLNCFQQETDSGWRVCCPGQLPGDRCDQPHHPRGGRQEVHRLRGQAQDQPPSLPGEGVQRPETILGFWVAQERAGERQQGGEHCQLLIFCVLWRVIKKMFYYLCFRSWFRRCQARQLKDSFPSGVMTESSKRISLKIEDLD